jgi:hypothetical protein
MGKIGILLYFLLCVATAMIGHTIHGGWFWTAMDYLFAPIALAKWLVCHQLNMTVLRATFGFLLQ